MINCIFILLTVCIVCIYDTRLNIGLSKYRLIYIGYSENTYATGARFSDKFNIHAKIFRSKDTSRDFSRRREITDVITCSFTYGVSRYYWDSLRQGRIKHWIFRSREFTRHARNIFLSRISLSRLFSPRLIPMQSMITDIDLKLQTPRANIQDISSIASSRPSPKKRRYERSIGSIKSAHVPPEINRPLSPLPSGEEENSSENFQTLRFIFSVASVRERTSSI